MYDIEFYEDKEGISEIYEYTKNLKKKSNKENKVKKDRFIHWFIIRIWSYIVRTIY